MFIVLWFLSWLFSGFALTENFAIGFIVCFILQLIFSD